VPSEPLPTFVDTLRALSYTNLGSKEVCKSMGRNAADMGGSLLVVFEWPPVAQ
jgi:hypothetical protein